jgi:hypothetical protein
MDSNEEYAEQYKPGERLTFVLLAIVLGGGFMTAWHIWVTPLWSEFAQNSACYKFAGIGGTAWVFYTLFVGLSLSSAIVTMMLFGRRGAKILRDGQIPYKGEKVFHRTKIRRGRAATAAGCLHVLSPLVFIAIAAWGVGQARAILEIAHDASHVPQCAAAIHPSSK